MTKHRALQYDSVREQHLAYLPSSLHRLEVTAYRCGSCEPALRAPWDEPSPPLYQYRAASVAVSTTAAKAIATVSALRPGIPFRMAKGGKRTGARALQHPFCGE